MSGDPQAIERTLAYTSEVLGLRYERDTVADPVPQVQFTPPLVELKPVADIAL